MYEIGKLLCVDRTSLAEFLTCHIICMTHDISFGVKSYLRFVLNCCAKVGLFLNEFCSSSTIFKATSTDSVWSMAVNVRW